MHRAQSSTRRGRPPGVLCLVTPNLDRTRPAEHVQCIRPRCRAWHQIARPLAAREGDMFVSSTVTRAELFTGTPVQRRDVLVFLVADEVQPGDFIALRWRGRVLTGFLEIEGESVDGERWLLTDAEGEPREGYFAPSDVTLIGRCVEVQRAGAVVDVTLRREAARPPLIDAA